MFSSDPGKLHFEGSVNLLRYIRENNTLDLKYYADMNDVPTSDDQVKKLTREINIHHITCIV